MTAKTKPLTKTELKRTASARAKEYCRENGMLWDWTESFNSFTRRKKDLFGLFDLVYFEHYGDGLFFRMVGVQVTQHNGNARKLKMIGQASDETDIDAAKYRRKCLWNWLRAGNRAQIWDYRHRKKGGAVVAVDRVVMPLELSDIETN